MEINTGEVGIQERRATLRPPTPEDASGKVDNLEKKIVAPTEVTGEDGSKIPVEWEPLDSENVKP